MVCLLLVMVLVLLDGDGAGGGGVKWRDKVVEAPPPLFWSWLALARLPTSTGCMYLIRTIPYVMSQFLCGNTISRITWLLSYHTVYYE